MVAVPADAQWVVVLLGLGGLIPDLCRERHLTS